MTDDFAGIEPWNGRRPCSPDSLPYPGRTARRQNFIGATGLAMLGLSLSPATGRVVEDLGSGREPSVPINLPSPSRY